MKIDDNWLTRSRDRALERRPHASSYLRLETDPEYARRLVAMRGTAMTPSRMLQVLAARESALDAWGDCLDLPRRIVLAYDGPTRAGR